VAACESQRQQDEQSRGSSRSKCSTDTKWFDRTKEAQHIASKQSGGAPEPSDFRFRKQSSCRSPEKSYQRYQSSSSYTSRIRQLWGNVIEDFQVSSHITVTPPPLTFLAASIQRVPLHHYPEDNLISSSSGGDRFQLSLANASRKVHGRLPFRSRPQPTKPPKVRWFATRVFDGRGVQIAEFSSFLSNRLSSGKNGQLQFKVVTFSGQI
jgi:hypothetical protein